MNDDADVTKCTMELCNLIDAYSERIDDHNLIAILCGVVSEIGQLQGYRKKDFNSLIIGILNYKERK